MRIEVYESNALIGRYNNYEEYLKQEENDKNELLKKIR